jgi:hypothetical protein
MNMDKNSELSDESLVTVSAGKYATFDEYLTAFGKDKNHISSEEYWNLYENFQKHLGYGTSRDW